jgi:2,4-dienoyl-CoA reductase-like NADH-dependent reductase (Old Yellow Enzyme family)
MSLLFSPLTIKSVTFKNRIAVSPMCQYSSEDGFANDWHLVHLGSRAIGGAGLIVFEATAVSPEGRISPQDLGIWSDAHIPMLKRITDFIHAHGSVAGIQLAHAGRKASTHRPWEGGKPLKPTEGAWQTLAPSEVPFSTAHPSPLALNEQGIKNVINDFKKSAERALEAGFKVIEIHAAHGYLLHSFLSPISNLRTDAYGGSFENRTRLLRDIVFAVKSVWPQDYPLFIRISATDWTEGGWNEHDSSALAGILQKEGVDLIDCSTGGNVPGVKIPVGPGYQVRFAEMIKRDTGILTAAVGMITSARQSEDILANRQADMVMLAREMLRNPYFPMQAAQELGVNLPWPAQYERAQN